MRPFFELGVRAMVPFYTTAVEQIMPSYYRFMPGFYGQLGLEIIVTRDIAISLSGRYTFMLVVNNAPMHLVDPILGAVFYF